MNNQQVREIAEAAFKARFGDIGIVGIDIEPGFDHYDDSLVEVRIIYDAAFEDLRTESDESALGDHRQGVEEHEGLTRLAASPLHRQVRPRGGGPGPV